MYLFAFALLSVSLYDEDLLGVYLYMYRMKNEVQIKINTYNVKLWRYKCVQVT